MNYKSHVQTFSITLKIQPGKFWGTRIWLAALGFFLLTSYPLHKAPTQITI